jgi:nucleoid DNA-binding protein
MVGSSILYRGKGEKSLRTHYSPQKPGSSQKIGENILFFAVFSKDGLTKPLSFEHNTPASGGTKWFFVSTRRRNSVTMKQVFPLRFWFRQFCITKRGTTMAAKNDKPLTKTQIIANIAANTGLDKKQVSAVLGELGNQIANSLSAKGPGSFTLPSLLKIEKKLVPAQKARKDVKNPFTGEIRNIPAKPAHHKIKIKALKALKEMA